MNPRTFGHVSVPGNRIGAVISIGIALVAWFAVPLARPFILGAGGLGLAIGLLLWRKHKAQFDSASDRSRNELPRMH